MRTSTSTGIAALSMAVALGGSLALGSAVVASATPTGPDERGRSTVLHLTAETAQFAIIDVGSKGPALGLGDQIVSSDQLTRLGKPAGRGGTVMTVVGTSPSTLTTQLVTTLDLVDGQIILHGIGDGPTGPPTEPTHLQPRRHRRHRHLQERPRVRRHHRPPRRHRTHHHPPDRLTNQLRHVDAPPSAMHPPAPLRGRDGEGGSRRRRSANADRKTWPPAANEAATRLRRLAARSKRDQRGCRVELGCGLRR